MICKHFSAKPHLGDFWNVYVYHDKDLGLFNASDLSWNQNVYRMTAEANSSWVW